MIKKRHLIVVFVTFLVNSIINAQIIEIKIQTVDTLVMSWNMPNAPGGVIGIMSTANRRGASCLKGLYI